MKVQVWSMRRMIVMITAILLNKFDALITIEGSRGLGKSTLAYQIAQGVSREFKKLFRFEKETVYYYYDKIKKPKKIALEVFVQEIIRLKEEKAYRFKPEETLLYQRKEIIKFLHKWHRIGVADEYVNAAFNRDFYNEEQKDLIKMLNMNRDHNHLFLSCVPQFQNLDSQIKNLCKIRLTVVRRGLSIIQTPNRSIYSKDKWDTATNEKIEKEWIKKGIQNPHYSKLTTFRGLMKFPPLTKKQEEIYQSIKNQKRNLIAREQMGIKEEDKDSIDKALELLETGRIRNSQVIDGMALSNGKDPEAFRRTMINRLKKSGKQHLLKEYYWENQKKRAPDKESHEKTSQIKELIKKASRDNSNTYIEAT